MVLLALYTIPALFYLPLVILALLRLQEISTQYLTPSEKKKGICKLIGMFFIAEIFLSYRIYWYVDIMGHGDDLGRKFDDTMKFLYVSEVIMIAFLIYYQVDTSKDEGESQLETDQSRVSFLKRYTMTSFKDQENLLV